MCQSCHIQNSDYQVTKNGRIYTSEQLLTNMHKLHSAVDYLQNLNRKWFKLNLQYNYVPYGNDAYMQDLLQQNRIVYAYHQYRKHMPPHTTGYSIITLNIHELIMQDQEAINETMRHEYAHAVVAQKYKMPNHGHGHAWIKIAKLMRCDTRRYEMELQIKN